jgi:hypothetical protein
VPEQAWGQVQGFSQIFLALGYKRKELKLASSTAVLRIWLFLLPKDWA